MLIYSNLKSKKHKVNKKQKQLITEWQELINRTKLIKPISGVVKYKPTPTVFKRETPYIPSKDTGYYNTFRKPDMYYTGDNMKGIGTLHKSNAVPIFTDEEAKDQATMRR
jgi:hypothetical protein